MWGDLTCGTDVGSGGGCALLIQLFFFNRVSENKCVDKRVGHEKSHDRGGFQGSTCLFTREKVPPIPSWCYSSF